jgi:hypothetical protein
LAAAFVNVQLMFAPAMIAAPGMVTLGDVEDATGFVLPVDVEFTSLQITEPTTQDVPSPPSVIDTAEPVVKTTCWIGEDGVAAPTEVVEMFETLLVRFDVENENGPPVPPVVTF